MWLTAFALEAQPVITQQPINQVAVIGSIASICVSVSCTGLFNYQWQLNGTNLPVSDVITTVAGDGSSGYSGDDVPAISASLWQPYGVTVDASGNLFIAEYWSERVRKVDTNGLISTVAGNGDWNYTGDGGQATDATLNGPTGVTVDAFGNLFIVDADNSRIRKVDTNGIITTVAGDGQYSFSGDGGQATNAAMAPQGVAVDGYGNLFIADTANNRVRKVNTDGIISTVAGKGPNNQGGTFSGDGGQATNAGLVAVRDVVLDTVGNLWIADGPRIRKVDTSGVITTVAGNRTNTYSGDGGTATNASLNNPPSLAIDDAGNLFIADGSNARIRKVDTNGIITTIAGTGQTAFSGDGGPATNASFNYPSAIVLDDVGNLYVADPNAERIRKVGFGGSPTLSLIVTTNSAGDYDVIIANSSGSITSSVATITVTDVPLITVQPKSQTNTVGVTVNFTVSATSIDAFNWQWQKTGTSLFNGGNLAGTTTSTLTVMNISDSDVGAYSVIVSNEYFSTTSPIAYLTVIDPPVITAQPTNLLVLQGTNVAFGVTLTGSAPFFCYQWQLNGTNIWDATNAIYTIFAVTTNMAGNYAVVVTNAAGSVGSSSAALTVVVPPKSQTNYAGSTATLTGMAYSPELLRYQWQKDGINLSDGGNISGTLDNILTISTVSDADAATYNLMVSNSTGSVITPNAALTVDDFPCVAEQPQSQSVVAESTVTFSAAAYGAPPLIFQWYFNEVPVGSPIGGTNFTSYILSNVGSNQVGNYSVRVVNGYGSVMSSNAFLVVLQPPSLSLQLVAGYPFLNLNGMLSNNFMVQYNTDLASTNWITLLSISNLLTDPYPFIDPAGIVPPARFYRIVLLSP